MVAHEKVIRKQRLRRQRRVRKAFSGTADKPRLTVHRTNKHIYCQLVDDVARRTVCSASTRDKGVKLKATGNIAAATEIVYLAPRANSSPTITQVFRSE